MWMSLFSKKSGAIPRLAARLRTYESAACADSFITSPSWPVVTTRPAPGIFRASTTSTSPPAAVHARPDATPTSSFLPAVSGEKIRCPRYRSSLSAVTWWRSASPVARARATLRHTVAIWRDRPRTPASSV